MIKTVKQYSLPEEISGKIIDAKIEPNEHNGEELELQIQSKELKKIQPTRFGLPNGYYEDELLEESAMGALVAKMNKLGYEFDTFEELAEKLLGKKFVFKYKKVGQWKGPKYFPETEIKDD